MVFLISDYFDYVEVLVYFCENSIFNLVDFYLDLDILFEIF